MLNCGTTVCANVNILNFSQYRYAGKMLKKLSRDVHILTRRTSWILLTFFVWRLWPILSQEMSTYLQYLLLRVQEKFILFKKLVQNKHLWVSNYICHLHLQKLFFCGLNFGQRCAFTSLTKPEKFKGQKRFNLCEKRKKNSPKQRKLPISFNPWANICRKK